MVAFNKEEREELARLTEMGKPRFTVGDLVAFKDENKINNQKPPLKKNQAIIIDYDMNGQHGEPSYDLWTEQTTGDKRVYKRVFQSELRPFFEN